MTIIVNRNLNAPFWPTQNANYYEEVNEEVSGVFVLNVEASDPDGVSCCSHISRDEHLVSALQPSINTFKHLSL